MKSSKEYMGQEMSTVPYRRDKKHHLKSWGFLIWFQYSSQFAKFLHLWCHNGYSENIL